MGLLRKSISLGLTGGMVGYRSKSEKQARRAKQAAKYTKQMAAETKRMADTQAATAAAEQRYLRQQTKFVASQQEIAEGEAHQRWLAAQPVTCGYCRTSSPPGTNFCPRCGSPDVAYREPKADGAPAKAERSGRSQSGPVAQSARAKAESSVRPQSGDEGGRDSLRAAWRRGWEKGSRRADSRRGGI
jgi:hypothetical protein